MPTNNVKGQGAAVAALAELLGSLWPLLLSGRVTRLQGLCPTRTPGSQSRAIGWTVYSLADSELTPQESQVEGMRL